MEKKTSRIISIIIWTLFFCAPFFVNAATLSVTPSSGTYAVGERVVIRVAVSGEVPLNALTGTLSFPTSLFSIESVSKAGSVLNFWIAEPSFSNQTGVVQFEGVALSGFQGGSGTVLTVYLKAIKAGSGNVTFKAGQVLANDGQGTDITSGLQGGVYVVEAASVKPQPEPNKVIEKEPEPEPEVVEVKKDLNAPEIFLGEQDGLVAIRGSSRYTKTDVILTFVSSSGSKVFITGLSNSEGNFSLTVPQALKNGPYSVTAIMVEPNGSRSEPSNTLTVEVGGVFYGDISWQTSTYALFVMTGILVWYVLLVIWRRRTSSLAKTRAAIKREVAQAKDMLQKSFTIVREDVDAVRSNSSDARVMGTLTKDLKVAEKIIQKEIEDINSIPIDDSK
ncbi:MAG: hypothetical protein RJA61_662 [Candidatus Parcubacteria bacterium]|jgi:hypothetical protein